MNSYIDNRVAAALVVTLYRRKEVEEEKNIRGDERGGDERESYNVRVKFVNETYREIYMF